MFMQIYSFSNAITRMKIKRKIRLVVGISRNPFLWIFCAFLKYLKFPRTRQKSPYAHHTTWHSAKRISDNKTSLRKIRTLSFYFDLVLSEDVARERIKTLFVKIHIKTYAKILKKIQQRPVTIRYFMKFRTLGFFESLVV